MPPSLSARDCRAVLTFIEGLHGCRSAGALARYVVRRMPALIGTCQTTWNVIAPGRADAAVEVWPPPADPAGTTRVFARHLLDHPGIVHYLRSGTVQPTAISDFWSARAFARSTIHDALYRDLGYADQLSVCLAPPGPRVVGLALGRSRRGFSARDRSVLSLLRPHLLHAHRTVTALARLAQEGEDRRRAWLVDLGGDPRRPRLIAPPAAACAALRRHFGAAEGASAHGLSAPLARWCAALAADGAPPRRLCQRSGEARIEVRYVPGCGAARPALLIEEHLEAHARPGPAGLKALGLSTREAQVLDAAARGLTNAQIGAALGIRAGTVRKHLEHVYARLGVSNRTAAAALARAARLSPD